VKFLASLDTRYEVPPMFVVTKVVVPERVREVIRVWHTLSIHLSKYNDSEEHEWYVHLVVGSCIGF
jgi:hypothetical protein